MNIELLAKMVGELILDHDEVALPGLGTFVAEMVPASFSDKGFTINPPYRKLSFRQREGSDSLLIDFYARVNDVDKPAAERMISQFVTELRMDLTSKKSVVFPKLGKLRATKENHFFFVPDEDLSIYPEGFGLIPVSLKSHEESAEDLTAAIQNLKDIVAPAPEAVTEQPAPVAAAAAEPEPSVPAVATVAEPAPAAEVEPEPVPEPSVPAAEAVAEPEPAAEAVLEPVPASEVEPAVPVSEAVAGSPARSRMHPALVALLIAAGIAVIFLGSVAILGRVAPQLIDPLLYSPEELRIINM